MEDKKMRSYAVVPPLLLDAKQRRIAFQNRNGLLQPDELDSVHNERKLINVWSSMEHELFKEKYLSHPKNFGAIGQSFEHKSVPDCVHHYYLTKKAENYKQLLRKSRRTRNTRNNPNNKVSFKKYAKVINEMVATKPRGLKKIKLDFEKIENQVSKLTSNIKLTITKNSKNFPKHFKNN